MEMIPEEEREPFEPPDNGSAEQPTDMPESAAQPEPETEVPEPQGGEAQAVTPAESPAGPEAAEPPEKKRGGFDEAFAEMRQSLREEETQEKTGFRASVSRLVGRMFRRKKAAAEVETEAPSRLDELIIPKSETTVQAPVSTAIPPVAPPDAEQTEAEATIVEEPQRPASDSSSFQTLVRQKMTGALPGLENIEPLVAPQESASQQEAVEFLNPNAPPPVEEAPQETEEEEAQSVLSALRRAEEEIPQEPANIRQAALEGYEVAAAEEEEAVALPQKLRRSWRDLRPIDRRLLTSIMAIFAVMVVVGAGYGVISAAIPKPTPPPATPTASSVPFPISLTLPGGWVNSLSVGHVVNGVWNPSGPEWLQGTEVCRWISLPWSDQSEAVLRTLKADDPIHISMSNFDSIAYKVKLIKEAQTPADLNQMASDTPCLLVILSKEGTQAHWAVLAKP